ncbi:MAG: hypothetical protein H7Y11_15995 [Armatimonadetes bacterium]|nr:hypothetical protein [Anaerolineae bacterium]
MTTPIYDAVVILAEQLTPDEQRALVEHLQHIASTRQLSYAEWKTVFEAMKITIPLVGEFSDRREDWYGDDGR